MPPKKQIKPPSGFKVKLDPKDEAKKLKNLEEQNKAIIIKNLAVKKEREGLVDEEEEDRIRNFLKDLQKNIKKSRTREKKDLDLDESKFYFFDFQKAPFIKGNINKKLENFMYNEIDNKPIESRVKLFKDIFENLKQNEIKDLINIYLEQNELSFKDIYYKYSISNNQENILREFLGRLDNIYNNSDKKKENMINKLTIENRDDISVLKEKIKTFKDENLTETTLYILEKINEFSKRKDVLERTKKLLDNVTDVMTMKNLPKLIKLYLSQKNAPFQKVFKYFITEDKDEKTIKLFLQSLLPLINSGNTYLVSNELIEYRNKNMEKFGDILQKIINIDDNTLRLRFIKEYLNQYLDSYQVDVHGNEYKMHKNVIQLELFYEKFMNTDISRREYWRKYFEKKYDIKIETEVELDDILKRLNIDTKYGENYLKHKNIDIKVPLISNTDEYIRPEYSEILNGSITKEIENFGARSLSNALLKISNLRPEYEVNSDYIQTAIKAIKMQVDDESKGTALKFIKKLGDTVIYLDEYVSGIPGYNVISIYNNTFIKADPIFINKIKNFDYNDPTILINLSPQQKLPNIFDNNNISNNVKENLIKTLDRLSREFVISFTNSIYKIIKPTTNIIYRQKNIRIGRINIDKPLKDVELEDDFVYYYDQKDKKTYKFENKILWNNIQNGDYTNPITKELLDIEFIKNFKDIYSKKILKEEDLDKKKFYNIIENIQKKKEENTSLAPNLFDFVFEDLDRIENSEKEIEYVEKNIDTYTEDKIETYPYTAFIVDKYIIFVNNEKGDISSAYNTENNIFENRDSDLLKKDIIDMSKWDDTKNKEENIKNILKTLKYENIYQTLYLGENKLESIDRQKLDKVLDDINEEYDGAYSKDEVSDSSNKNENNTNLIFTDDNIPYFLTTNKDVYEDIYSPTRPEYSPTKPGYDSEEIVYYSPTRPEYSPTRPEYDQPVIEYIPVSPEYNPTSPPNIKKDYISFLFDTYETTMRDAKANNIFTVKRLKDANLTYTQKLLVQKFRKNLMNDYIILEKLKEIQTLQNSKIVNVPRYFIILKRSNLNIELVFDKKNNRFITEESVSNKDKFKQSYLLDKNIINSENNIKEQLELYLKTHKNENIYALIYLKKELLKPVLYPDQYFEEILEKGVTRAQLQLSYIVDDKRSELINKFIDETDYTDVTDANSIKVIFDNSKPILTSEIDGDGGCGNKDHNHDHYDKDQDHDHDDDDKDQDHDHDDDKDSCNKDHDHDDKDSGDKDHDHDDKDSGDKDHDHDHDDKDRDHDHDDKDRDHDDKDRDHDHDDKDRDHDHDDKDSCNKDHDDSCDKDHEENKKDVEIENKKGEENENNNDDNEIVECEYKNCKNEYPIINCLKSYVMKGRNKKPEMVYFCSFICFEKYDSWSGFKKY